MPNVYCPRPECSAKASYDVTKPTKCPKCGRAFADAFKTVAAPAPVQQTRATVEEEPFDERPTSRSALAAARAKHASTTRVVPRTGRPQPAEVTHLMNPPADLPPAVAALEDDPEDENVDPREVRRRARELAATIDTSTIVINDQDDGVFKFSDMWAAGAASREKATQSKPSKRKARR